MIFLLVLALVWILFAAVSDLRSREVPDYISFSFITFALAYRAFYAVFNSDVWFFLFGVIFLVGFIVLGYAFYYGRVFAGGDAKLMMALGAVLPLYPTLIENIKFSFIFVILLMFSGAIYGLVYSCSLFVIHFKEARREFSKQFFARRNTLYLYGGLAVVMLFFPVYLNESALFLVPLVLIVFPFLYSFAKAVENVCLIREIDTKNLTEGDWIYKPVRIGNKIVKPDWEGLSKQDMALLRKRNKLVWVKEGIPFVPAFLVAFLILVYLWYSSWSFFQIWF